MNKRLAFHGSDLEQIEKYYHIPKEEIVGFGANVNPLGLSKSLKQALSENLDIITSYPDREYTSLRRTIGDYCHADPNHIVVGNGSTELISMLIQHRHPKKALLLPLLIPNMSANSLSAAVRWNIMIYPLLRNLSWISTIFVPV